MTEELTTIADDMAALLPLFVDGGRISGLILPSQHAATFKARAIEAKSIIDQELGMANAFSLGLLNAVNSGSGGLMGGPSYASVEEASQVVLAAVRAIDRKRVQSPRPAPGSKRYVDLSRMAALQSISGVSWDFSRLVELCRELNVAHEHQCHLSTAMLLRTILNHVPPVLGFNTFAEVASNYGGPKSNRSFKDNMHRLEKSLRSIADIHLHSSIRSREDLPTAVQVDFAADLDLLLGEVIRVASEKP
jgi:hypothetical protein